MNEPHGHCRACLKAIYGRHVEVTIKDTMSRKPDRSDLWCLKCAKRHKMMPDDPPQWGRWNYGFAAPLWRRTLLGVEP